MNTARHGSTVTLRYIGTLDNGRIFYATGEDEPLVFTIGQNAVFPALEQAVLGMAAGETRNITIPAADAYGPRREENIIRVDRTLFPAEREIRAGQKLSIGFKNGQERTMVVCDVDATTVTLDGNHPLAGLDLTFALKLERIEENMG
ncbi:peptidylprolyl isomerase [Geobacter sp. SVR]|uniref:FKBP-type peptidyl-prolyl cis-trans isomerase n=1 Tax=Geobacter sp. SVR TaxID=2495594 RepID=UPI00143EF5AE|nr:FKBP-type peptidyl-prolyl cis-trans isomerase [Geobacter sp. SVR]BCS55062.1 peptidyl-prolyl cis-trans isomerase [Geobacter sp. SVR]GCF85244.1 peptidyl-prolyl cis-trans isomerase [Geobacter sp. SVR]